MRWHLYCRVVDNFGDVGVAWRLAADLAARGERCAWRSTTPARWPGWRRAARRGRGLRLGRRAGVRRPTSCVELFGGGPPDAVEAAPARRRRAPRGRQRRAPERRAYVERSHGLPSPQANGAGLPSPPGSSFPASATATGGLVREPGLLERRRAIRRAGLARRRSASRRRPGERRVGLFCYERQRGRALLDALAAAPTLLLLAPGAATEQAARPARPVAGARRAARGRPAALLAGRLRPPAVVVPSSTSCAARTRWCGRSGPARPSSGSPTCRTTAPTYAKLGGLPRPVPRRRAADLVDRVRRLFAHWNDGASGSMSDDGLAPATLDAWASLRPALARRLARARRSGHCGCSASPPRNDRIRGFAPFDRACSRVGGGLPTSLETRHENRTGNPRRQRHHAGQGPDGRAARPNTAAAAATRPPCA